MKFSRRVFADKWLVSVASSGAQFWDYVSRKRRGRVSIRKGPFCAVVACNDNMKGWSGAISFVTSAGCVSKTP
jgi:hypothetical protein